MLKNLLGIKITHARFLRAVQEGEQKIVEQYMTENCEDLNSVVNTRDEHGTTTALNLATQFGHAGIVKALLAAGADPNARDHTNLTPLSHAVIGCYTAIIEILIAHPRLNPNAKNKYGRTALHYGARLGRKVAVHILLNDEPRIELSILDDNNFTAEQLAVKSGYSKIACMINTAIAERASVSAAATISAATTPQATVERPPILSLVFPPAPPSILRHRDEKRQSKQKKHVRLSGAADTIFSYPRVSEETSSAVASTIAAAVSNDAEIKCKLRLP